MLRTTCITTVLAVLLASAAVSDAERSYPVAFPEGRPWTPPESAPAVPIASPPGVSTGTTPTRDAKSPPPDRADWVLRRMAGADSAEARKRAAEAWPVSKAVMDDLNTLVYALADPDPRVREGAVNRLRSLEPAIVFGFVMRTMVGGSADRVRALDASLPAIGNVLEPYMHDTLRTEIETSQHRRIAAYCLGRMGAEDTVDTLAAYAWGDDEAVARACVDALYMLSAPAAEPHWMRLLEHPNQYFRQQAVYALAMIDSQSAFDKLRRMALGKGDPSLHGTALHALNNYPPEILFPVLVEILEANAPTRAQALRLLRARTGLTLGARAADWRAWLNDFMAGPPPPPIIPAP